MLDLEQQLRSLGRTLDASTPAVTAAEAQQLAEQGRGHRHLGGSALRWPLTIAAVVLLLVGIAAAVVQSGDDGASVVAAQPGGYPLDIDGHREWMVALLNGEADTSDDVLRARFARDFLEAVPPDGIRAIAPPLALGVPWTISTEVERRADVLVTQRATLVVGTATGEEAELVLERGDEGRLDGLSVTTQQPCAVA